MCLKKKKGVGMDGGSETAIELVIGYPFAMPLFFYFSQLLKKNSGSGWQLYLSVVFFSAGKKILGYKRNKTKHKA